MSDSGLSDLSLLRKRLEGLKRIRATGVLTVEGEDGMGRVTYRSDAELVSAIASIEAEIARAQGRRGRRSFRIFSNKGW